MPRTTLSRLLFPVLTAFLLVCSARAQAPGYLRVALVIGNGEYVAVGKLINPPNDARAMAETLRNQGFEVIELVNGTRRKMLDSIAEIRDKLKNQNGIGMFYYAGHGLQSSEHNYLVPVDARISKASDIKVQTVDVQDAITAFKNAGNRMNIIVLDACRDNPFGKTSEQKGLAPLDAPAGTFLAYATAPGNVAEDGDANSGNGLYTGFLLQEMKRPQARIEDVFKRVRYQVRQKSEGRQIPWESTSLEEDFVFSYGQIVPPQKPTVDTVKPAFEAELAEWNRVKNSRDVNDIYAFLLKFPNGGLSLIAQGRIEELKKASLIVQGGGADGSDAPLMPTRYVAGQNWEKRSTTTGGGATTVFEARARVQGCTEQACTIEEDARVGSMDIRNNFFFSIAGGHLGHDAINLQTGAKIAEVRKELPDYIVPPGLLQVGQHWVISDVSTVNAGGGVSTLTRAGEGRVISREPVTTPAGTFDTFRVKRTIKTTISRDVGGKPFVMTADVDESYWLSPNIPYPVKTEARQRSSVSDVSTIEMITRYASK